MEAVHDILVSIEWVQFNCFKTKLIDLIEDYWIYIA